MIQNINFKKRDCPYPKISWFFPSVYGFCRGVKLSMCGDVMIQTPCCCYKHEREELALWHHNLHFIFFVLLRLLMDAYAAYHSMPNVTFYFCSIYSEHLCICSDFLGRYCKLKIAVLFPDIYSPNWIWI